MIAFWNRPCAAKGLISYRLRGPYGWIMIGAKDHEDAVCEAGRSTDKPKRENLEIWDNIKHEYKSI